MRSESYFLKGSTKRHCDSTLRLLAFCSLLTLYLLTCVSCKESPEVTGGGHALKTAVEQNVTGLIASEDLILDLTPQLKSIALWIEQRAIDGEVELSVLDELSAVRGLAAIDSDKLFSNSGSSPEFLETAQ